MKKYLMVFSAFILIITAAQAQSPDEKQIRDLMKQMADSWIDGDYAYEKVDALDDKAVFVNPVGMYWKNKMEIQDGLRFLGGVRFKYLETLDEKILLFRFLSPTSALVVSRLKDRVTQDFTMPGSTGVIKKGEISEGMITSTFTKINGRWKVTSMHLTHIAVPARSE